MDKASIGAILFKERLFLLPLVLFYLIAGLIAIAFNYIPGKATSLITSVLVLTLFMAFYSHLVMKSTVAEMREKNWLFLRTLPLSSRFLYFSKFSINWSAFLALWCLFLAGLASVILPSPRIPSMVFSLYVMIFALYPAAFSVILVTGLITRSEGTTILSLVFSNSLTTIFISFISNSKEIQEGFPLGTFSEIGWLWPAWAINVVSASIMITLFATAIAIAFGFTQKN